MALEERGLVQRLPCDGTRCVHTCLPGHADCNGDDADGCEVDTTSPSNCGGCLVACPGVTGPHTVPACLVTGTSATCGAACGADWRDCDGNLANGCEVMDVCYRNRVLFSEDFSGTTLPNWSLELPWHKWLLGMGGYTPVRLGSITTGGLYSADCRVEGYATMTRDLDMRGTNSITLQFDSFSHRGISDGYAIQVSTDLGATWTTVSSFSLMTVRDWESRSVDLSAFVGAATLRFRFYFVNVCSASSFEWSLDNVSVVAAERTY